MIWKVAQGLSWHGPSTEGLGGWCRQCLLAEQVDFDCIALRVMATEQLGTFNPEKHIVDEAVMESYYQDSGKAFFVQSVGKTYICNTIAASIYADGEVVLCVASSPIAARLLDGGQTTHSHFKTLTLIMDHGKKVAYGQLMDIR